MEIQLDEKWWIKSSEKQFNLATKNISNGEETLLSQYYFTNLSNLFRAYFDIRLREGNSTNLKELRQEISEIENDILRIKKSISE